MPIKRALISVSDKSGIAEFAQSLVSHNIEILSTGGTAKLLQDKNIPVIEVSDYTGFPEMMNGRVKTLHPKIHGGLLALRDNPEHAKALADHEITPIDLVCVNLYPFEATIAKEGCTIEEAIENIDIGGPSMVRSASKNNKFVKSRIHETKGFSFSSSQIINSLLDIYPEKTKSYIREFSKKYSFNDIVDKMNSLKDMKVLLIGDGIIDEYYYCESMEKSPKAQLIVNKYVSHEVFAGGAFAIANHVAGICDNVQLVTLLGREDSREDFILENLKPNVGTKFFYRDDGPSIVKRRYISQHHKQKIFEINHINDNDISEKLESEVFDYIKSVVHEYDLILVSDFGHGFITDNLIGEIEEFPIKMAVNAQTNGANAGYNLITKYKNTNFICLDAPEARLATQEKHAEIEYVASKLLNEINMDCLIITVGAGGSICINREGEINLTPALATKVVDVIGAGDAFFSLSSLCFALEMPIDLVSFFGNAIGALSVRIVGNKRPVEGHEIKEFIHTILS